MSESNKKRIIIVENDYAVADGITEYLQPDEWEIVIACSALEFYKKIDLDIALAIINTAIPDQSGFVLVKYFKSVIKTRIIIVSENSSRKCITKGYRCGADLFMAKPLNLQDLGLIVSNMTRGIDEGKYENKDKLNGILVKNKWQLKVEQRSLVTSSGKELALTGKEFDFINCLVSEPNTKVSRDFLMDKLGYYRNESGHRSLESLVYRLRKKISPSLDTPIKAANASGYTFTAKVVIES